MNNFDQIEILKARIVELEKRLAKYEEVTDLEQTIITQPSIKTKPFSYSRTIGVMSNSDYQELINNIPTVSQFAFSNASYPDRGFIFLGCNEGFMCDHPEICRVLVNSYQKGVRIPESIEQVPAWARLLSFLRADSTLQSWITKYRQPLIERLGEQLFSVMKFYHRIVLVRDKPGYQIMPHTDTPRKLLTWLYYLPNDDSISKYGTSLFEDKTDRNSYNKWNSKHQESLEGFSEKVLIPFEPNSGVDFVVGPDSWHGAKKFDGEGYRDSLQLAIYPVMNSDLLKKYPQSVYEVSRTTIINLLIYKNLFRNYLEIGVKHGSNYKKVLAKYKTGIDSKYSEQLIIDHIMTSDDFFANLENDKLWDIIFIDASHESEQVIRDIEHSLDHLQENGMIVLHDCNPKQEAHQIVPRPLDQVSWNGDVWKAFAKFRMERVSDLQCFVIDTDNGIGVITRGPGLPVPTSLSGKSWNELNWFDLEENRQEILNLLPFEVFYKNYCSGI